MQGWEETKHIFWPLSGLGKIPGAVSSWYIYVSLPREGKVIVQAQDAAVF